MSTRKKIVLACCGVLVAVVAVFVHAVRKSGREHGWWHQCRHNCWLIDDAKKICAEQSKLATGTIVTWQDIQSYFTSSQYWGWQHPSPTEMPRCPSGGTYEPGKIGSWSLCSIPYHQWANCLSKDGDNAWR